MQSSFLRSSSNYLLSSLRRSSQFTVVRCFSGVAGAEGGSFNNNNNNRQHAYAASSLQAKSPLKILRDKFFAATKVKHTDMGELETMVEDMKRMGIKMDSRLYQGLFNGLSNASQPTYPAPKPEQAALNAKLVEDKFDALSQAMKTDGVIPDQNLIGSMMKVYAASPSNVEKLEYLLQSAKKNNIVISNLMKTMMLKGYANSKQNTAKEAWDFFSETGCTDDYQIGFLLRALAKETPVNIKQVKNIHQVMKAQSPGEFSRTALAKAYAAAGDKEEAVKILKGVVTKLKGSLTPDNYNRLIQSVLELKVYDGLTMAREAVESNVNLNEATQNMLVKAYLDINNFDRALELHNTLLNEGILWKRTRTRMLQALSKQTTAIFADKAIEMFEAIPEPDRGATDYYYAIKACSSAFPVNVGKANELFSQMQRNGIKIDSLTVSALLKVFAKNKASVQEIEDMFEQYHLALGPNDMCYLSLMGSYANAQPPNPEKLVSTLERMQTDNLKPSVYHYNYCVKGYAYLPEPDMASAQKYVDLMEAAKINPDVNTYNYLLRGLVNSKEMSSEDKKTAAKSIKEKMEAANMTPTENIASHIATLLGSQK